VDPCTPAAVVDGWPQQATLRAVAGDPFSFGLQLRGPDGLVDVSAWDWAGSVTTGRVRLHFETMTYSGDDGATGVRLWLRGDETAQLPPGKGWPFDVACRQPAAGEGVTVLAGEMFTKPRVTDPLRSDPDAAPRDGELVQA
jgi:hypothetical protein